MLDTIRRHQQSWLTYLIFAAIIVVFALNFGPGSSTCRSGLAETSYAAIVDGQYIRQQDFASVYSQQLEQMRRRAQAGGFELNEKIIEQMGLKQQVLDQLISTKLIAAEAERRGLRVTDEELLDYLDRGYRVKEVNPDDYRSFVERNFRTTVQNFEDERRQELLAQKLVQLVEDGVTVSDQELRDDFMRDRDRAMIDFVRFDLTSIKLDEPTAAEIDKLIAAEPKAVEERYQVDAARYRTPEERQARAIFLKVAKDASEADVARARSELMTLKDQIASGADFAALAKQRSQDEATKDKGGDLGWHKRGELDAALDQAAFSLKLDELTSEPVRTDTGLYLLQLKGIKASQPKPLDEVKREVVTSMLRERNADAKLKLEADKLFAELKAGKKLEDLTTSEDEAGKNKEPAAGGKPAAPKAPVANKPVRHASPWIIKTQEAIPLIGVAPDMQKDIFALTKDNPLAPKTYQVGRAYYVVVLKDREMPDPAKFDAEKDSLRQQALWSKRTSVLQDWVHHLRAQADVELNPGLFASRSSRRGR